MWGIALTVGCVRADGASLYRVSPRAPSADWSPQRVGGHELDLRHARHGGHLWVRVVELSEDELTMTTEEFARAYLRRSNQAWWGAAQSELRDDAPGTVAGAPAHFLLVDGRDDQRAVWAIVRGPATRLERHGDRSRRAPVALLVGYEAPRQDFERALPDYAAFLESIHFDEERSP